jgi:hypothetical protein
MRTDRGDEYTGNTPAPADIIFISPGTNIRYFNLNTTNPNIHQHSYVMSEYNPSDDLNQEQAVSTNEISITTGVYDEAACLQVTNLCPTGIFLADDVKYGPHPDIDPDTPYSVTYVYTTPDNIKDKYRTDRPDLSDVNIENMLLNWKVDHQASDCGMHTENWRRGMLMMTWCFYEYLSELEKYRTANGIKTHIIVYYRGSLVDDYKFFLAVERQKHTFDVYETLWQWLTSPKTPFLFKLFPSMSMNQMLAFFQRSIPIAFLSGDNTPAEFISVNPNPIIKLVYAAFYWKRALARALGVTVESGNGYNACGVATINREQFLSNVRNNFAIAGMEQVETLIVITMLGRSPTCENKDFRTIVERVMDGKHFVYNPNTALEGNTIRFKFALPDSVFNTKLIRGDLEGVGGGFSAATTLRSSWTKRDLSKIFIKKISCENPIYANFKGLCKGFTVPYTCVGNPCKIDECTMTLLLTYQINTIITAEPQVAPHLIYTYATVFSDCSANKQLQEKGLYIIQEFIPSLNLRHVFRCKKISPHNLSSILEQLFEVLKVLYKYKIVHNDLWLGNVMIISASGNVEIKIIDFDEAFMEFKDHGFISAVAAKKRDVRITNHSNSWDLFRVMADLLDIYHMGDFHTELEDLRKYCSIDDFEPDTFDLSPIIDNFKQYFAPSQIFRISSTGHVVVNKAVFDQIGIIDLDAMKNDLLSFIP